MKIYKHNRSKIYGAEASSKPEGASTSFLSKTDNDYYNDILCNPELYPNMIANIVWMTPDDFIVQCATGAGVTVDDVLDVLTQQTIDDYAAQMRSGVKFYLPYLVYKQQGNIEHEGRHRALAAKSNGDKFIPILIIKDKSNKHINHEIKAIVCRPSDKYSVENCPVFLDFEHSNSFAVYKLNVDHDDWYIAFAIYTSKDDPDCRYHAVLYTLLCQELGIPQGSYMLDYRFYFTKNVCITKQSEQYDDYKSVSSNLFSTIHNILLPKAIEYYT